LTTWHCILEHFVNVICLRSFIFRRLDRAILLTYMAFWTITSSKKNFWYFVTRKCLSKLIRHCVLKNFLVIWINHCFVFNTHIIQRLLHLLRWRLYKKYQRYNTLLTENPLIRQIDSFSMHSKSITDQNLVLMSIIKTQFLG